VLLSFVKNAVSLKNKLFLPAIIVPAGTILWNLLTGSSALIGLGISSFVALGVALVLTKCETKHARRPSID
jgi:uncharacterized membrane protein